MNRPRRARRERCVRIGTVIENRPDGSIIYMSSRGVVNVDSPEELEEIKAEDASLASA